MTTPHEISTTLRRWRYNTVAEEELQRGIATALTDARIAFRREAILPGDVGRVDFLVEECTAVEVKRQGVVAEVMRQLERYAGAAEVSAVVLATTKASHLQLHGLQVGRHVIHVALIGGSL